MGANVVSGDILEPDTMIKNVAGGAAVILHPWILGKILYSPGGIKWLSEGFRASPGSKQANQIISRLVAIAANPEIGIAPAKEDKGGQENIGQIDIPYSPMNKL